MAFDLWYETSGRFLPNAVTCAAHHLQTAIGHAFNDIKSIDSLLAKSRKLIVHVRHSAIATEELLKREKQLQLKVLKLRQDCPTRWNSAFLMVDRLIEVKLAVTTVLQNDDNYKHLNLSDREWSLAKEL